MEWPRPYWKSLGAIVLGVGVATGAFAQQKTLPDAQIEANVLKSLASAPELADQAIGSSTVYGVVTLSGSVETEALRDKAEKLVANTAGVKKVVDELIIGTPAPAQAGVSSLPEDQGQEDDSNAAQPPAQAQEQQPVTSPPPPPSQYPQDAPSGEPPSPPYPPAPPQARSQSRIQQQPGQSVIVRREP